MIVGKLVCSKDVLEGSKELNSLFDSIMSLDTHDLFYHFSYIELGDIFPELPGFNLSIIKEILNQVLHDIC